MGLFTKKEELPPMPAGPPRAAKWIGVCLAATALLTVADLWSKDWALETLSAERTAEPPPVCEANEQGYIVHQRRQTEVVELVEGSLEFRYQENCGAAFGLFRNQPAWVRNSVFGLAAVLASLALLWMFAKGRGGRFFAMSVPFVVSGAIGNLVDRLRLGYVVDFIRFYWDGELFGLREWPTFNVADVTITIGVIFLIIDGYLEGKRHKAWAAEQGGVPAPGAVGDKKAKAV